ncbi:MAG: preprotein translocase subunit SecA [Patescibacteria group bacterium]
MAFLSKIFGDADERRIREIRAIVHEINARESEFEKLSDGELMNLTQEFKRRLNKGDTLDDLLPDAFAAGREAARRAIGQRHFDVQLVGGVVLHQGKIAEMRTGEGKTLVATLPLYLNALAGRGAHLVTPNDYLSRVGAGWMGPVYNRLGVSVGVVTHEFSGVYAPAYEDSHPHGDLRLAHFLPCSRREAYMADITYGTNNEFGFDYLRDNLENAPDQLRQLQPSGRDSDSASERGHYFAIVDEADSILIDEARTPLIISAPDEESGDLYNVFAEITPQLKENEDYNVDEKMKAVSVTDAGIDKVERILGIGNIYEEKGIRFVRHLEASLRARALFIRDRDYVVKDGEVIIVDEFTGRLMPGRRWSEGLHQAVEAKEGVAVQKESRTLATVTFQNYFRMYEKLSGMTGTAQTSAEEFHKVYNLDVITIPTHRPMIRGDRPDFVFKNEKGKEAALVREVRERHEKGQPVLIGTVSIEKNERLSRLLETEGVPHAVLNAKNHEQEALIVAQAGRRGAVTVATNMAGRGVDIILGGSPGDEKEAAAVRDAGGLHVIGTERHEARRIDNQLRGRAGRQGDPGSSQFFVSLEDDLMRIFGSDKIKRMMEALGIPDDQPIEHRMVSRALEAAQAKIEGFHFDSRKHVLEYDDVLNKQRDAVYRMRREILFSAVSSSRATEGSAAISEIASSRQVGTRNDKIRARIFEMIESEVRRVVSFHTEGEDGEGWNTEEIFETIRTIAEVPDETHAKIREIAVVGGSEGDRRESMIQYILEILRAQYAGRAERIGEDGMKNIERAVMLRAIDTLWMDHLDEMEHLRDSVRLRAYGARDPLVEYKNEGLRLFRQLQSAIRVAIVQAIFKVSAPPADGRPRRVVERHDEAMSRFGADDTSVPGHAAPLASSASAPAAKEPSRNAPCPCDSGKKYKRCHGK